MPNDPSTTPVPPDAAPMRYDHVVDGFYKGAIADVVIDYFENRHPLQLPMDRGRANIFAESIRRLIAGDSNYRTVAITTDVIREALITILDQARSSTKTE